MVKPYWNPTLNGGTYMKSAAGISHGRMELILILSLTMSLYLSSFVSCARRVRELKSLEQEQSSLNWCYEDVENEADDMDEPEDDNFFEAPNYFEQEP